MSHFAMNNWLIGSMVFGILIEIALMNLHRVCAPLPIVPRLEDRIFIDYGIDEEDTTDTLEAYANDRRLKLDGENTVTIPNDFTVRDYILQFKDIHAKGRRENGEME